MATILCLTRGGEKSHPTQDRAIALARARGARLLFLFVSDVRFVFKGSAALLGDIERELDEMGEFLLTMAQERADKAGVQADILVENGAFLDAIKRTIQLHAVSTVVLGAPRDEDRYTTREFLDELGTSLESEFGVEVLIVEEPRKGAEEDE